MMARSSLSVMGHHYSLACRALPQDANLLLRKSVAGLSVVNLFGIDAHVHAAVDAGQQDAISLPVEQSHRKTLLAAYVVEGVIANQTGALKAARHLRLKHGDR